MEQHLQWNKFSVNLPLAVKVTQNLSDFSLSDTEDISVRSNALIILHRNGNTRVTKLNVSLCIFSLCLSPAVFLHLSLSFNRLHCIFGIQLIFCF